MLVTAQIKKDFPIFTQLSHGKPLIYLDSAATTQKPQVVIDAISQYYLTSNANVHRGVHHLSEVSTTVWEKSRATIAQFFGANVDELIMVRNATEAINGVAYGWADHNLSVGDVIVTTILEHHSNFVVWQEVARRTGCSVQVVGVTDDGRLDLSDLEKKLQLPRVKLLAIAHVSNTLGTVLPLRKVVELVRQHAPGARILVDGAQSAPHLPINFHDLGVDFFAFSGHKLYGPMGSGGLLVRQALLDSEEMHPWYFGGGMIDEVHIGETTFAESISDRFTPGTPDVASAAGLAAACLYLSQIGMQQIAEAEQEIVEYALQQLSQIPQIQIVGPTQFESTTDRVGSVTFLYEGVHAHDVAQILDSEGVAVRSGHHCTMPLHEQFSWPATVRASFGVYTTTADIDGLVAALAKVAKIFHHV
ncbi:SufS family cysteine desulfurase [Candidatus Woesebacteria bacterium]|nr:SufS family cysteine desulfurase [Candidatus Woesebacteria bacterium]